MSAVYESVDDERPSQAKSQNLTSKRFQVAAHLFRSDRNRRVRTEQKCLKEIEYTLFYLTAHTSSDQTGTDASDHIRTEVEFFERFFLIVLMVRRGCACAEGRCVAVAGEAHEFHFTSHHVFIVCLHPRNPRRSIASQNKQEHNI